MYPGRVDDPDYAGFVERLRLKQAAAAEGPTLV
jgi:hypothetical protein